MFRKVLIAIDDSETYQSVFEEGLAIVKSTKANLLLLHVINADEVRNAAIPSVFAEYYPTVSDEVIRRYAAERKAIAQWNLSRLQTLAHQALSDGVTTEFMETVGDPGRSICTVARDWNTDLIVVGRREQPRVSEWLLGSVSNYVLHHASCAVLVIPKAQAESGSRGPQNLEVAAQEIDFAKEYVIQGEPQCNTNTW